MSRNSRLEVENQRLSMEVEEMKEICAKTSSINVKYKMQLDSEKQTKEELLEGNAKLKKKVNELAARCYEQNEHIRVLENNLRRGASASMRSSRVTIIGNVNEIIQKTDPKTSKEYIDLEERYSELDKQYQEALSIIDELEFELEDVSMKHVCFKRQHKCHVSSFLLFMVLSKCEIEKKNFFNGFQNFKFNLKILNLI